MKLQESLKCLFEKFGMFPAARDRKSIEYFTPASERIQSRVQVLRIKRILIRIKSVQNRRTKVFSAQDGASVSIGFPRFYSNSGRRRNSEFLMYTIHSITENGQDLPP